MSQSHKQCSDCGNQFDAEFNGPCSNCGSEKLDTIVTLGIATEHGIALPITWMKEAVYYEKSLPLLILTVCITVVSPFLGLMTAGWPGVAIGLVLGLVCLGIGVRGITKVVERERSAR